MEKSLLALPLLELGFVHKVIMGEAEGYYYKVSYLADLVGSETVMDVYVSKRHELLTLPLIHRDTTITIYTEDGKPLGHIIVDDVDDSEDFPEVAELYKSCWEDHPRKALLVCECITESIHQSFDGWTESEQVVIKKYLNDISTAVQMIEKDTTES